MHVKKICLYICVCTCLVEIELFLLTHQATAALQRLRAQSAPEIQLQVPLQSRTSASHVDVLRLGFRV